MKRKTTGKSSEEFDRRFDSGEDIHELIDMSRAIP
jgi:biotin operon repressor